MYAQKYIVCVVLGFLNFFLQGAWYGPLFGKVFMDAYKKTYKRSVEDHDEAPMTRLFIISGIIGFIYPLIALFILESWPQVMLSGFWSIVGFSLLTTGLICLIEINSSMWESRITLCLIGAGKQLVMNMITVLSLSYLGGIGKF